MRIVVTALLTAGLCIGTAALLGGWSNPLAGQTDHESAPPEPEIGESVAFVTTGGEATLKLCRNWLFTHTCRQYGHVAIPARVAAGDSFEITLGSNPKTMWFRVKSILRHDDRCLMVPRHEDLPARGEEEPVDMLIVESCTVLR